MFVKIHGTKEYIKGNKISCSDLVEYLSKENEGKELIDKEHFFNQNGNNYTELGVQKSIDNNVKGLHKNEAKFYMLTINPSQKELQHLAKSAVDISSHKDRVIENINDFTPEELKRYNKLLQEYTNNVMEAYAINFNRGLSAKDIVYFGKVEQQRKFSSKDVELSEKVNALKDVVNDNIKSVQKSLNKERVDKFIKYLTNTTDEEGKDINKKVKELSEKVYDMKVNKNMSLQDILKNKDMFEENKKAIKFFYENGVVDENMREFLGNENNKDVAYYFENGVVKEGDLKPGFQSHIHVVVSRMDKNMEHSLSPLANHRDSKNILNEKEVQIGFDRSQFAQYSETIFDEQFKYNDREFHEYLAYSKSYSNHEKSPVQLSANQINNYVNNSLSSSSKVIHEQDYGQRENSKAANLAMSMYRGDSKQIVQNMLKMGEFDSMQKTDLGTMGQAQFLRFAAALAKGNPVSIAKETLQVIKSVLSIEI